MPYPSEEADNENAGFGAGEAEKEAEKRQRAGSSGEESALGQAPPRKPGPAEGEGVRRRRRRRRRKRPQGAAGEALPRREEGEAAPPALTSGEPPAETAGERPAEAAKAGAAAAPRPPWRRRRRRRPRPPAGVPPQSPLSGEASVPTEESGTAAPLSRALEEGAAPSAAASLPQAKARPPRRGPRRRARREEGSERRGDGPSRNRAALGERPPWRARRGDGGEGRSARGNRAPEPRAEGERATPREPPPRQARRGGKRAETGAQKRGQGPGARAAAPKPEFYSLRTVVDHGFEDVAGEEEGTTRRLTWTIEKRGVADKKSGRSMTAVYVLERDGVETEFPSLGAARAAVNKRIEHPERLTRPKAEYARAKK